MKIIPSILSDDQQLVAEQLRLLHGLDEQYEIDRVQVDIVDGNFADNVTITPLDMPNFEWGELEVDVHLMTHEPLDFVYEAKEVTEFIQFHSIIGQVEKMSSQEDFVQEVKKQHWRPGLCLDLYTPISELSIEALQDVRVLQIMGIQAGFQGQTFVEHTYETIKAVRTLITEVNPTIELLVDGGVKADQLVKLAELGVDGVVVGSILWKSESVEAGLDSLYEKIAELVDEE
ncbi:hypothetical protein KC721_02130 [Candidatus Woesebacteria bacterium]|nr:hypothetical protein [Candidatus Woesebacteria bacterium]